MKIDRIIKTVILLVIAIPLLALKKPTFNKGEACKTVLYSYFDFLKDKNKNRAGKTYYAEYTTWNEFNKSTEFPNIKTITKVLSSSERMLLENENIKIYGDTTIVFIVLPKSKQIYINDSDSRMFLAGDTYDQLIKVEETLLESTDAIVCETKATQTEFTIIPSETFEKQTHLKRQQILYDNTKNRIFKIDNNYSESHKLKRQIIQYDVLEFNSKRIIKSPKKYLYNGNVLKPEFVPFEIIDHRNTPK